MSDLRFNVPGTPQPGGSKRAFVNPKTGKVIVTDDNPRAKPWQHEVAAAAREAMAGRDAMFGPVELMVLFFMPRPKSHYRTGRYARELKPSAPLVPTARPDATKLLRALEDALTGIVWCDDAQVYRQDVMKVYAGHGYPIGASVQVTPADFGAVGDGDDLLERLAAVMDTK